MVMVCRKFHASVGTHSEPDAAGACAAWDAREQPAILFMMCLGCVFLWENGTPVFRLVIGTGFTNIYSSPVHM